MILGRNATYGAARSGITWLVDLKSMLRKVYRNEFQRLSRINNDLICWSASQLTSSKRLSLFGHLAKVGLHSSCDHARALQNRLPKDCKHLRGRPRSTWLHAVHSILTYNLSTSDCILRGDVHVMEVVCADNFAPA